MGRRPYRWDAESASAEEIDLRNRELVLLERGEKRLRSLMSLAVARGITSEPAFLQAKRINKRFTECRRRGIQAIQGLLERCEQACGTLLCAMLPRVEAQSRELPPGPGTLQGVGLQRGDRIRCSPQLADERARLRGRIVVSVLDGESSPAATAEAWSREFRKAETGTPSALIADVPAALHREFTDLHPTTVWRWTVRVRKAREEAKRRGLAAPTEMDILRHRQPAAAVAARRKRTPQLVARVTAELIAGAGSSKDLASQMGDVSARTIRRAWREDIDRTALTLIRGGPQATEELLLSRLPRRPKCPHDVWQIDDSHVSHDLIDRKHIDELKDVDFDFHCVIRRPDDGGLWYYERVEKIYVQVIVDAFSRTKLLCRIFPSPPTARDTLVSIAMAAYWYGLPNILYSDNGANFRAEIVARLLQEAGVQQIFSRRAQPRGRGIVENAFHVLKKSFFDKMPGHGGAPWPDDLLLDMQTLQHALNAFTERAWNLEYHRGIGMSPRECLERNASGPATTDPRRVFRLLPTETAVKHAAGIRYRKGIYRCDGLVWVPVGASVEVHAIPDEYDRVYLTWWANGTEVFLGEGIRTDDVEPAESIDATRSAEYAALQEVAAPVLELLQANQAIRAKTERQVRQQKEARSRAAATLQDALAGAQRGLLPGHATPQALLPSGSASAGDNAPDRSDPMLARGGTRDHRPRQSPDTLDPTHRFRRL